MQEVQGDLFTFCPPNAKTILRCIPTNGVVNKFGHLIMGKGVALAARRKYPGIDVKLGELVANSGNKVYVVTIKNNSVASFPTKHHWRDPSDLRLIVDGCNQLRKFINGWDSILLPRVGCGFGGLSWAQVKTAIAPILPEDKFYIVDLEN